MLVTFPVASTTPCVKPRLVDVLVNVPLAAVLQFLVTLLIVTPEPVSICDRAVALELGVMVSWANEELNIPSTKNKQAQNRNAAQLALCIAIVLKTFFVKCCMSLYVYMVSLFSITQETLQTFSVFYILVLVMHSNTILMCIKTIHTDYQ